MADTKISELTAATSVAAADSLVLVQSGVTKKVTSTTLFKNIPVSPVVSEAPEVVGTGVIDPTKLTTVIESAVSATSPLTLATGSHGTFKEVVVKSLVNPHTAVITVSGGKGFTTITFSSPGQSVYLRNISGEWYVISYRGAVIA